MIGPKEWEELKKEIAKLDPILRIKRLKQALIRTADSKIKREIDELILKAESDSIEFFDSRKVKPVLPQHSLEKLVSDRKFEEGRQDRKIEDIASEESGLTDSEVKQKAADYDPNKKNEFYESDTSESITYKPVEHDAFGVKFEDNSLNRRKDYVNKEEVDFNGARS